MYMSKLKEAKLFVIVLITIGVVIMLCLTVLIIPDIMAFHGTLERYQHTTQAVAEEGGLGKHIYRLPTGIKDL